LVSLLDCSTRDSICRVKSVFSTIVALAFRMRKKASRHRAESSAGKFGTRRSLNWTGQSACQCSALTGAGNSQKIKARDVLPQGSSGHFARLSLETGECLSAAEHNAPVAVHTQWHRGGIAYGTNVPEYL
jgi:hypothetical protein